MTTAADTPVYDYVVTVPGFIPSATAGAAPTNYQFTVKGSFLENHGETYLITDQTGAVVCLVPLGSVVTRSDALA